MNLADGAGPIAVRKVHDRRRRLAERVVERVARHAGDDETPAPGFDAASQWFAAIEEPTDELLVDDDLWRRRAIVEIGEIRSAEQRNAHDGEVAGRDRLRERPVGRVVVPRPALDGDEANGKTMDVERHRRRNRGAADGRAALAAWSATGGEAARADLVDRCGPTDRRRRAARRRA